MKTIPLIIKWGRLVPFAWHTFIINCRAHSGRWHVLRDRPDWFVCQWVDMVRRGYGWGNDDIQRDLAEAAEEEWQLRKRRRNRGRTCKS